MLHYELFFSFKIMGAIKGVNIKLKYLGFKAKYKKSGM